MECRVCKVDKEKSEFYKHNKLCKKCRCLQTREWAKKNKEKVRFAENKRRSENKEKEREKNKRLYWKNHERSLKKARKWRENNREKTREWSAKWKKNNPEKVKKYQELNKEKFKSYAKKWKEKDPERTKEILRRNVKISRERFPEKNKARKILFSALRVKFMTRPTNCSKCLCECKPDGHHIDYTKPLEVIWLCKSCHAKEHKKLKCKAVLHG
jgi:hypothetical protein